MKCLVIVESPSKCKIITNYLNNIPELVSLYGDFTVIASCGHIRDLKKKELSIDINNDFRPDYEVIPDTFKKKLVHTMKTTIYDYVSTNNMILLATDSDAEGSAISWHICDYFKLKPHNYKRIIFNEITKQALKHAVLNAGTIDMHAVDAQESRRILDRIVGYQLSPLLWSQFNQNTLSAGRVQSAALNIILKRNIEINDHIYQPYWKNNGIFKSEHKSIDSLSATHQNIWDSEADAIKSITKNNPSLLAQVSWNAVFKATQRKKNPPPPLITSTLQQECFKRFKINSKNTMLYAQHLYEAGHITYMRTDSTQLSQDMQNKICAYISQNYGSDMVCARKYETKNSSAQEAHEAIRPTQIDCKNIEGGALNVYHQKIYDLIWKYTVSSQMIAAIYTDITYIISPICASSSSSSSSLPSSSKHKSLYTEKECADHIYIGKTSILLKLGFMTILMPETKANPEALDAWDTCLNKYKEGLEVKMDSFELNSDVYRPAPQFNEASFIKILEKEGIGRPSTYVSVVNKLYDKQYIIKGTNNEKHIDVNNIIWNAKVASQLKSIKNTVTITLQDTSSMIVTDIGKNIINYISTITPYLIDSTFTKLMESDLDKIVSAQTTKLQILQDFYNIFGKSVNDAQTIQKSNPVSTTKKVSKLDTPLKDFPELHCSIVNTKYGPALYNKNTKKFHSILPFLEWRNIQIDQLHEKDIKFILDLPLKINTSNHPNVTTCYVELGRYGLYLKVDGKNVKLHPELMEDAYNNILTYTKIIEKPAMLLQSPFVKSKFTKKFTKKPTKKL